MNIHTVFRSVETVKITLLTTQSQGAEESQTSDSDQGDSECGSDSTTADSGLGDSVLDVTVTNQSEVITILKEAERANKRETECVCVCVCVRQTEREREEEKEGCERWLPEEVDESAVFALESGRVVRVFQSLQVTVLFECLTVDFSGVTLTFCDHLLSQSHERRQRLRRSLGLLGRSALNSGQHGHQHEDSNSRNGHFVSQSTLIKETFIEWNCIKDDRIFEVEEEEVGEEKEEEGVGKGEEVYLNGLKNPCVGESVFAGWARRAGRGSALSSSVDRCRLLVGRGEAGAFLLTWRPRVRIASKDSNGLELFFLSSFDWLPPPRPPPQHRIIPQRRR